MPSGQKSGAAHQHGQQPGNLPALPFMWSQAKGDIGLLLRFQFFVYLVGDMRLNLLAKGKEESSTSMVICCRPDPFHTSETSQPPRESRIAYRIMTDFSGSPFCGRAPSGGMRPNAERGKRLSLISCWLLNRGPSP